MRKRSDSKQTRCQQSSRFLERPFHRLVSAVLMASRTLWMWIFTLYFWHTSEEKILIFATLFAQFVYLLVYDNVIKILLLLSSCATFYSDSFCMQFHWHRNSWHRFFVLFWCCSGLLGDFSCNLHILVDRILVHYYHWLCGSGSTVLIGDMSP